MSSSPLVLIVVLVAAVFVAALFFFALRRPVASGKSWDESHTGSDPNVWYADDGTRHSGHGHPHESGSHHDSGGHHDGGGHGGGFDGGGHDTS